MSADARILLLRGINLGPRNRIAMPELRAALEEAGMDDVRTYVASGNVVVRSRRSASALAKTTCELIAERFGLQIAVVGRTRDELAAVVDANPLGDVVTEPKRYQVSFLEKKLPAATAKRLAGLVAGNEKLVVRRRELYAWHPAGVARSKLWNGLASSGLGVTATARNWTTVTKLLSMADEE